MLILRPVLADEVNGDPRIFKTAIVRFHAGGGILVAPISGIEGGTNHEWPIHDDA